MHIVLPINPLRRSFSAQPKEVYPIMLDPTTATPLLDPKHPWRAWEQGYSAYLSDGGIRGDYAHSLSSSLGNQQARIIDIALDKVIYHTPVRRSRKMIDRALANPIQEALVIAHLRRQR